MTCKQLSVANQAVRYLLLSCQLIVNLRVLLLANYHQQVWSEPANTAGTKCSPKENKNTATTTTKRDNETNGVQVVLKVQSVQGVDVPPPWLLSVCEELRPRLTVKQKLTL